MTEDSKALLGALQPDGEPQTVESLAERLPGFSREAIAQALDMLAVTGVLRREKRPDGTERFHYEKPHAYKLIDTPVIRQEGPNAGRR